MRRSRKHLFPGDGKEAAAILVCNRYDGTRLKLLAKKLILVPYQECKSRTIDFIWLGSYLEKAIDTAEEKSMSMVPSIRILVVSWLSLIWMMQVMCRLWRHFFRALIPFMVRQL